jgi:flavin reductase (DIM6/NTAB) family NADH-FMN oxidoreductase RutF
LSLLNKKAKQFSAVRLADDEVQEKVCVTNGGHTLDITQKHNIACQSPFCIAICFTAVEFAMFDAANLFVEIKKGNKTRSSLKLSRLQTHTINGVVLAWFIIEKATCCQLNFLSRYIALKYSFRKNNTTLPERNIFGALYSYPRKIIVVSFKHGDYYNIFPMDFQCYIKEAGIYLLGLRTTNITLQKIIEQKKFVISGTGTANLKTILSLGAYHSNAPPAIKELPFETVNSEVHQFPVPAFTDGYKELELVANFPLGSHTLLIGKLINEKLAVQPAGNFYYVHFFELAGSNYKEV